MIRYVPRAGELRQFACSGEDDDTDVCVAEHRDLVGLLEQAIAALGERDLPARGVLDPTDGDAPAAHRMVTINIQMMMRMRMVVLMILGESRLR